MDDAMPVSTHADKNRRLDEMAARLRSVEADLAKATAIIREVLGETPAELRKAAERHGADAPGRETFADFVEKSVTLGSWLDAADLVERYPAPPDTFEEVGGAPEAVFSFGNGRVFRVPAALSHLVAGARISLLDIAATVRGGGKLQGGIPGWAAWALMTHDPESDRWSAALFYDRDRNLIEPTPTSPATPGTAPSPAS